VSILQQPGYQLLDVDDGDLKIVPTGTCVGFPVFAGGKEKKEGMPVSEALEAQPDSTPILYV